MESLVLSTKLSTKLAPDSSLIGNGAQQKRKLLEVNYQKCQYWSTMMRKNRWHWHRSGGGWGSHVMTEKPIIERSWKTILTDRDQVWGNTISSVPIWKAVQNCLGPQTTAVLAKWKKGSTASARLQRWALSSSISYRPGAGLSIPENTPIPEELVYCWILCESQ